MIDDSSTPVLLESLQAVAAALRAHAIELWHFSPGMADEEWAVTELIN